MTRIRMRSMLGVIVLAATLAACGAVSSPQPHSIAADTAPTSTTLQATATETSTSRPTDPPTSTPLVTATETTEVATTAATDVPATSTASATVSATASVTASVTSMPTAIATSKPLNTPTPQPTLAVRTEPSATSTRPAAVQSADVVDTGRRGIRGATMPRGALNRRPWMVMIDNHPDAYPQSGLDKAAIVFEGLAEYGITRYIATFADGWTPEAAQVGPIRSTRQYFVQWAMAFHPVYAHAGGSPDGLSLVQTTNQLINFEGLNQPNYSYRDNSRVAPHNLYTTSALLRAFAAANGVSGFADPGVGYLYANPAPLLHPQATALNYYFLDASSAAGFVYSPRDNVYYRTIFGHAHVDRMTGAQLWANNVVVMAVDGARRPGDAKARIDQYVIGNGPAKVFKDGTLIDATWVKNSGAGALRFYDNGGNEVVFSSGSLWIAAIPSLDRLTIR